MTNKNLRDSIDKEMASVKWRNHQRVRDALNDGKARPAKARRSFLMVAAAALVLMTVTALAMTLLFTPKYDAGKAARQAIQEKYGLSDTAMSLFVSYHGDRTETPEGYTYVFRNLALDPDKAGYYTVQVDKSGKATAAWSHDGVDLSANKDKKLEDMAAWGAAELELATQQRIEHQEEEMKAYSNPVEVEGPRNPLPPAGFTEEEKALVARADKAMLDYGMTKEALALFIPELRKTDMAYSVAYTADYNLVPPGITRYLLSTDPYEDMDSFGTYLVSLNESQDYVFWEVDQREEETFTASNWGQAKSYNTDVLPLVVEFVKALQEVDNREPEANGDTMFMSIENAAAHDQLYRDAGFSAKTYAAGVPQKTDVQQDKALEIAKEVLEKELGATDAMIQDSTVFTWYNMADYHEGTDRNTWTFAFHLYGENMKNEYPFEQQGIRVVTLYADTGEVIHADFEPTYASNG